MGNFLNYVVWYLVIGAVLVVMISLIEAIIIGLKFGIDTGIKATKIVHKETCYYNDLGFATGALFYAARFIVWPICIYYGAGHIAMRHKECQKIQKRKENSSKIANLRSMKKIES